jgi:hypothetical protein
MPEIHHLLSLSKCAQKLLVKTTVWVASEDKPHTVTSVSDTIIQPQGHWLLSPDTTNLSRPQA